MNFTMPTPFGLRTLTCLNWFNFAGQDFEGCGIVRVWWAGGPRPALSRMHAITNEVPNDFNNKNFRLPWITENNSTKEFLCKNLEVLGSFLGRLLKTRSDLFGFQRINNNICTRRFLPCGISAKYIKPRRRGRTGRWTALMHSLQHFLILTSSLLVKFTHKPIIGDFT